jgi:hypothetical protein
MKKLISSALVLFTLLATLSACVSSSKMKNRHYQQWSEISGKTNKTENQERSTV